MLLHRSVACLMIASQVLLYAPHAAGEHLPRLRYSGRDVFRGIFFLSGPVADRLPTLRGTVASQARLYLEAMKGVGGDKLRQQAHATLESVERAYVAQGDPDGARDARRVLAILERPGTPAEQIANIVLNKIEERDRTFLERFGTEVQSGDQVRVRDALKDGAQELLAASEDLSLGQSIDDGAGIVLPVVCAALLTVALVSVVAVAAYAYFAIGYWLAIGNVKYVYNEVHYFSSSTASEGSLELDLVVDQIARTLGPQRTAR